MRRVQSSGSTSYSHPISSSQSKSQAEETAKAVKDAAKAIRDAAISTREAVKAFSDSGIVTELADSYKQQRMRLETQHKVEIQAENFTKVEQHLMS